MPPSPSPGRDLTVSRVANIAMDVAILPADATGRRRHSLDGRMVRLKEITAMRLVHLEFEASKILTALEDMRRARTATALAAARALADALADAAETGDSAAEIAT